MEINEAVLTVYAKSGVQCELVKPNPANDKEG